MFVLFPALLPQDVPASAAPLAISVAAHAPIAESSIPDVPFYSQFADVTSAKWKKQACGVASLAMIIGYYEDGTVDVDALLKEAIAAGAYQQKAGWTYAGLIGLARDYGLSGASYDLAKSGMDDALASIEDALERGPVIASVHYKFDPASTIPHLVVVTGIQDGLVHYNDPAAKAGGQTISVEKFKAAWKKRYIMIRPAPTKQLAKAA